MNSDERSIITRLLPSEAATAACAHAFAAALRAGLIVTLEGELGAGKTAFVRACLRALGVRGPVKSPTYALVETYSVAPFAVHHIDFYRLEHPFGWRGAGLEECFHPGAVVLIEWPSKAQGLPTADVALTITVEDETRRTMQVVAHTAPGLVCVERWLPAEVRFDP